MSKQLLIGCGHMRDKRINPHLYLPELKRADSEKGFTWEYLETLDHESLVCPDIVWDLNRTPWSRLVGDVDEPLNAEPLPDSSYSEIHAYEVLEHLGGQGNYRAFFACFQEIWRLLEPGGFLAATVPSRYSAWLWADPGHCRVVLPESLVFLSQVGYEMQQGRTAMSDYRRVYRGDFDILYSSDNKATHAFVLQAVKPARIADHDRTQTHTER